MGYTDSNGRYRATKQKTLPLRLGDFTLAAGVALATFADADSAVPGYAVDDGEAQGIRWNNHATPDPVFASALLPDDLKPNSDILVHAVCSKTGATGGDATTFTLTAFAHAVGDLRDADANMGGATGAIVGNATTKTIQKVTRTLLAANLPAAGGVLDLSLQPTDGTLGTDDITVHSVHLEYTAQELAE